VRTCSALHPHCNSDSVNPCRCAGCAIVMLQDTTLLRNTAGFGAGVALAGDPAARASIMKSSFIENEATGGVGEGTGLTTAHGKVAVASSTLYQT
jgi:hypothetical protein